MDAITDLLAAQCGVVARRQLRALGLAPHEIRRRVRRHTLTPLFPGVYVNHTGAPTWIQRAWGAVLYAWPAALSGASALRAAERRGLDSTAEDTVEVAIDHRRKVVAVDRVAIRRRRRLDDLVQWNLSPPRLRYEEAVVDEAVDAEDELDAIAALARACGSRRTTAARLAAALARRSRVTDRRWLQAVLRDVAEGTQSVLEHGYLTRVERPHRLPRGRRQLVAKTVEGTAYRDVQHGTVVVELDGRIYHESASKRDDDLERDLDVLVEGRPTARLGWGQVFRRPCTTAVKLARLFQAHGWHEEPTACSPDCAVGNSGATR
ncbi:type IV toxin-antitoxin system AbiEi family antitoxin domain-containing protein [Mumia sp. DW29H23]|uniref:type IV toxin-antitoxin system AbiEi family antitoxin domain-containing protein n=1 Tax=Mumia sp. DW29H23 TaxID=3421241 RepID=UPI003D693AC9